MPSTFHHGPRLKWRRWRAVSPVSVLGALCDVSLSPRLLVLSATLHRSSSCTGQRPELHRILALLLGGFPLCPHAFYADNMPIFFFRSVLDLSCIVVQFASTKSLLSYCVPGSGVQQWRSVHVLLVYLCSLIGVLQDSLFLLCYRKIHTRGRVEPTTTICANATPLFTTSSAHAMHARERRGFCALTSYTFACIPTKRPTCKKLL